MSNELLHAVELYGIVSTNLLQINKRCPVYGAVTTFFNHYDSVHNSILSKLIVAYRLSEFYCRCRQIRFNLTSDEARYIMQ